MFDRAAEPADLNQPDLRARAVKAARGQGQFDVLVRGGTVVDMVTGRLRPADVGLVGPLIASVHETGLRSDAKKTIDASGCFVSPGLIDTHLHIESSMITPAAYCDQVVPRGVTSIVWDPHEFANTCGVEGMEYALANAAASPLRMLTLAPSCVPSAPGFESTGADFTPAILSSLLGKPAIAGVGELMSMQALLDGDQRFTGIVQAGLQSGKRVCGHARGLEGGDLNAYVAAGVQTDHELTSGDDLLAKLEAGLTIEMRGSHDHLLPQFVDALEQMGRMPQTLTLCTDDVFIDDLVERGGLDDVVRRLVAYGLDPMDALQAATLNAAVRIGRPDLGLVAPGKRADLVLFKDLQSFNAHTTVANGIKVAEGGKLLLTSPAVSVPVALHNTMQKARYTPDDFKVPATGNSVDVAVIEKPRFTAWGARKLPVVDGFVDCPADLTRMAVVKRFGTTAPPRLAFLGEWGVWSGAFATTVSHDAHNLTVFGGNEADMALAANTLGELGGGLAVVSNGQVKATLPLPVAGLVSTDNALDIARQFRAVRSAMDEVVKWQPPYLVFKACFGASLVCNPGPRLSDVGIVDTGCQHVQCSPVDPPPQPSGGEAN